MDLNIRISRQRIRDFGFISSVRPSDLGVIIRRRQFELDGLYVLDLHIRCSISRQAKLVVGDYSWRDVRRQDLRIRTENQLLPPAHR